MIKKFEDVKIKATNEGELKFTGTLQDWFLEHDGGELGDVLWVVEWCLPLLLGTETKVLNDDFNTGKWIVEIQE